MKYLKTYESFVQIDKLLTESVLVYSKEFSNKLDKLSEYYPDFSELLTKLNGVDFPDSNICDVDINTNNPDVLKFTTETQRGKKTQEIKTGRLLTRILDLNSEKTSNLSSEEMEKVINMFKAIISYNAENFKEVSGDEIYAYYSMIDYDKTNGKGQLGKSCMNKKPKEFFDLYTKNPDKVKLVVLEKDGKMVGRALLWETDNGFRFLDRIYTYEDFDIESFKLYADEKGYWYKEKQNTSYMNRDKFNYKFNIVSKNNMKSVDIIVSLKNYDVEYYPYLDSLCYFNTEEGKLSNHRFAIEADLLVCNMDGGYKPSDFEWVFN
jgi:hypothetical protein